MQLVMSIGYIVQLATALMAFIVVDVFAAVTINVVNSTLFILIVTNWEFSDKLGCQ